MKNVEQDLKSVQAQLDRMEERRKTEQKILEEQTAKTNATIENALKNLTGQLLLLLLLRLSATAPASVAGAFALDDLVVIVPVPKCVKIVNWFINK